MYSIRASVVGVPLFFFSVGLASSRQAFCQQPFIRSDCDASGDIAITDGVFLLNFLFTGEKKVSLGRRRKICTLLNSSLSLDL